VSERRVGWGVMGAAAIDDARIPGLIGASNGTLKAIASRRQGVADQEARRWAAPVAHDSYAALLADEQVEAVYIPVPNDRHAEWTVRPLEADKHVLCEKPLGLSEHEVELTGAAAERSGRLVLEAFMYHYDIRFDPAVGGGIV
jgi:xylose dehydrogenase (NAD/NADP)